MFPDEFKDTLVRLAETDEDIRTLLGLFAVLKSYTTEESLAKNFTALTGKDCRDPLRVLKRWEILKVGANDEYLCLSGYEDIFNETIAAYAPQPGDLQHFLERALAEGDLAALKMLELLVKIGKLGICGFSQYELLRRDLSSIFSSSAFRRVEEQFIKERSALYGKRRDTEFLALFLSESDLEPVKQRFYAWKQEQLAASPMVTQLEKMLKEQVADARRGIRDYRTNLATQAGMSAEEFEDTVGYFSGFDVDDTSFFFTSNMIVGKDKLYVAVTDQLSSFDILDWKDYPVLFVLEETPKWLGDMNNVFANAYPKLKDRKIALVVPGRVGYANYEQRLLSDLVERLGVDELKELPRALKQDETAVGSQVRPRPES
ncbi:MAG TPA: hypothetical protein ENN68_06940 [Methanomicrobia archaeon]|nr:hypothetical protein [Methanomicrobia archaeon]